MLTNLVFLEKIEESFRSFIKVGTSRSTAKLKPLHGAIAKDIADKLGENYIVKSQGYGDDKEASIKGRYVEKMVDITIKEYDSFKDVAGIGVKFVMQNYSQNSNNYFENMLGETANIRTTNCPYFQVFIILDKLPYYQNNGAISKWEEFTDHNITKYCCLSFDDINCFYHTPNKLLIYVVHIIPEIDENNVRTKNNYLEYYRTNKPSMVISEHKYPSLAKDGVIILNNYELFMDKVYHTIMAR